MCQGQIIISSGKLSHDYGKSQFSMGKLTISMVHFPSKLFELPESITYEHGSMNIPFHGEKQPMFDQEDNDLGPGHTWRSNAKTMHLDWGIILLRLLPPLTVF